MMKSLFLLCILMAQVYVVSSRCCSPPPTTPRPSRAPTYSPTRLPSAEPSRRPSRGPTPSPTRLPSIVPTRKPSRSPTPEPSTSPSEEPTYAPSQPTSQPSSAPTTFTPRPSYQPSIEPSLKPSTQPSSKPSVEPTKTPTRIPTKSPTLVPSRVPTVEPTEYPTISFKPTLSPSAVPSTEPTHSPTIVPSLVPSVVPSVRPSTVPTAAPTTTIAFALRMDISQVLVNIDAAIFQNTSANNDAFSLAVSKTVGSIEQTDVSVNTVTDTIIPDRRSLRGRFSPPQHAFIHLSATVPEINVEYTVSFVVHERGFIDATQASEYVQSQLRVAVSEGTFTANLASAAGNVSGADPSLLNVTAGTLTFLRTEVTVLRSVEPTIQPTGAPETLSAGGDAKGGFVSLAAGAQAGIILAIILGTIITLFLLYLLLRRVKCASGVMGQGAVLWYELVRPRGHDKNPYRGDKKATAMATESNIISTSTAPVVGNISLKNPTNLLYLSRHAAATESLMEELDSLFARLPPPQDGSTNDNIIREHPLTAGLDSTALPPVVFPVVRDLATLLKPPDPPRLLLIGRNCPATQRALSHINYSLEVAGVTLPGEAVENASENTKSIAALHEEKEEGVMPLEGAHFLYPPTPPPASHLPNNNVNVHNNGHMINSVVEDIGRANKPLEYVDALSRMILSSSLETATAETRPGELPPPPPSTSPSTMRTEFTARSESSAMFADCLEGPPARVPAAVVASSSVVDTSATLAVLSPPPVIMGTVPMTAARMPESDVSEQTESDTNFLQETLGQVRKVSNRRSPRSPTLSAAKDGKSAFIRPKAI